MIIKKLIDTEVKKVLETIKENINNPALNDLKTKIKTNRLLNEAPMDKRFQREWEKSCKALLNHLKHESKNKKYDRTQSAEIFHFIGIIEDAMKVPAEMAEIVGTN